MNRYPKFASDFEQERKKIWNLIQSCYNSVDFENQFYPDGINIESQDDSYRVDIILGESSISLTIEKRYLITQSDCHYVIKLMKNGQWYRQTQQELIWKIINQDILPNLRNIVLETVISNI